MNPAIITASVIGIGNPVLGDDAIGLELVDRLAPVVEANTLAVRLYRCYAVGVDLIEMLSDCQSALLIEGVITGAAPPGFCHVMDAGELALRLPHSRLADSHGVGLGELLALAERLGYRMPATVRIVGVEITRMTDIAPQPSVSIREKIPLILDRIFDEVYDLLSFVPR